jgi:hypothetical protein
MTKQNSKNESEKIFEQYLDSNGFQDKWEHEPTIKGKSKKPDYLLNWKGENYFFEVKELRIKLNQKTKKATHIDPYPSLRGKINEVRKQFKEYKEYSCSLVVFNYGDRSAVLSPDFIFGAMLGNLGISADFDAEKGEIVAGSERNVFTSGGRMIDDKGKRQQNTTISAIIVLEEFLDNIEVEKAMRSEEKKLGKKLEGPELVAARMKLQKSHHVGSVPRVVVIENPFARMPFPEDLFNGQFDERWMWDKDKNGKVERTFAGDKLKEWETLKENTQ